MCNPALIAVGVGGFQMIAGIQQEKHQTAFANAQAQAKYNAQRAQAHRNNQIATQNYNNQLRIAEAKDKVKKDKFAADLDAYEKAIEASQMQSAANALEANRSLAEARLDHEGQQTELAFKRQEALANMIQSQGQMLATGNVGQSFLLSTENAMRVLGQTQAELDALSFNNTQAFGLKKIDIGLDYASSEWAMYNNLPGVPQAQQASLLPYKPIMDPGPQKPIKRKANYWGAIAGGINAGLSAGFTASGGDPISDWANPD
tara:strand:+ start:163 stop:942 length:780 start_codon:yes stop_codon:yes gene_type:complete